MTKTKAKKVIEYLSSESLPIALMRTSMHTDPVAHLRLLMSTPDSLWPSQREAIGGFLRGE